MKRLSFIFSFTILCTFSFIWSGCPGPNSCDDDSYPTKYYYISQEAHDKVPYDGIDTLKFLLNGTDTITYVSNQVDTTFEFFNSVMDCSGEYQYLEQNNIIFNCINLNAPTALKQISFSLRKIPWTSLDYLYVYTQSNIFKAGYIDLHPPFDFPSMIINNVSYNNVDLMCRDGQSSSCEDTSKYVLYNAQVGILKIKTEQNVIEVIK